jgi:hypothetical protein
LVLDPDLLSNSEKKKEVDRVALPRSKSESLFDDPLVDNLAVALLS